VLGAAAAITLLLGIDDLFMIHDGLFVSVGIPESIASAFYLVAVVTLAITSRRDIRRAALAGIGFALVCWGASSTLDHFFNESVIDLDQLGEDGLKFLGAVVWSTAWIGEAYGALTSES